MRAVTVAELQATLAEFDDSMLVALGGVVDLDAVDVVPIQGTPAELGAQTIVLRVQ